MELVAEGLRRGEKLRILGCAGVCREDGRPGKAEQMILFEVLHDSRVHIPELAAVALVEDDDHMALIDRMISALSRIRLIAVFT